MANLQSTAIIRDRGQLTIPKKMRKALKWTSPNSVVSVETNLQDEIIIKPIERKKSVDWDAIWKGIERSRSFVGKRGNLSGFIAKDRKNPKWSTHPED